MFTHLSVGVSRGFGFYLTPPTCWRRGGEFAGGGFLAKENRAAAHAGNSKGNLRGRTEPHGLWAVCLPQAAFHPGNFPRKRETTGVGVPGKYLLI